MVRTVPSAFIVVVTAPSRPVYQAFTFGSEGFQATAVREEAQLAITVAGVIAERKVDCIVAAEP